MCLLGCCCLIDRPSSSQEFLQGSPAHTLNARFLSHTHLPGTQQRARKGFHLKNGSPQSICHSCASLAFAKSGNKEFSSLGILSEFRFSASPSPSASLRQKDQINVNHFWGRAHHIKCRGGEGWVWRGSECCTSNIF